MPQGSVEQKIAAAKERRKRIDERLATLKRESVKQQKAVREQRARKIGRLAYHAGLFAFTDDELETAFEHLKNTLEKNRQNGRNLRDALQRDDEHEETIATSNI